MSVVFGGMAASLDGYIASESGDLAWLNDAMAKDEDYGFEATERRTGAYVMGANTYREVSRMGGGGARIPTYVVTHDPTLVTKGNTELFTGDLGELVSRIRKSIPEDKDICLFGGGELVTEFVERGLIDELGVSVIPVLLGGGVPFFRRLGQWTKLELLECRHYASGIVLLNYRVRAPGV